MQTHKIEIQHPHPKEHEGYLMLNLGPSRQTHEIGQNLSLGRDQACGLVLNDPFISSRHCRIERREDGFLLRDLRSRNGTLLNGTKVLEAELHDGDRIQLGNTLLVFNLKKDASENLLITESQNPFWNLQLSRLDSIAESELPALLLGNSGTGKELLALQIHRKSSRRHCPFVSVNCSALGESLVESELFGHVRGSFTGATHDRKGAFESARGGTLFLDEVGDLPLSLQPKLLRALENHEIRPVGSDKVIKTDVRIIAATHSNLKAKITRGLFRSDLYYRLHGVQLNPPDLKDRMEDFDRLLYFFARQYKISFSYGAIQKLKEHSWPGNIRELKNVVARAKALLSGEQVQENQLDDLIDRIECDDSIFAEMTSADSREGGSLFKELERRLILERMAVHKGNQRRVAEDLGMPKSTLNDRIKVYQIDPKKFKS